jgi:hypothetical protein
MRPGGMSSAGLLFSTMVVPLVIVDYVQDIDDATVVIVLQCDNQSELLVQAK